MDYRQTTDEVRRFLKARVPVIIVRTVEPMRASEIVSQLAAEFRQMPFFSYTRTEGLREVLTGSAVTDDYSLVAALDQAQQTFRARANVNFVFSDLDDLEGDTATSRHLSQLIRLAERNNGGPGPAGRSDHSGRSRPGRRRSCPPGTRRRPGRGRARARP